MSFRLVSLGPPDERDDIIQQWLAEGHDNLLTHAAKQLAPATPRFVTPALDEGSMYEPMMWRRTLNEPRRLMWRCRVCGEHVSEVARMAPDPRVREHQLDHCEQWLVARRYVVPGRYEHRDVLADALSLAFSTLARTVR